MVRRNLSVSVPLRRWPEACAGDELEEAAAVRVELRTKRRFFVAPRASASGWEVAVVGGGGLFRQGAGPLRDDVSVVGSGEACCERLDDCSTGGREPWESSLAALVDEEDWGETELSQRRLVKTLGVAFDALGRACWLETIREPKLSFPDRLCGASRGVSSRGSSEARVCRAVAEEWFEP